MWLIMNRMSTCACRSVPTYVSHISGFGVDTLASEACQSRGLILQESSQRAGKTNTS